MAVQEALNIVRNTVASVGRAGLSALYPNEFEYYLVALELVTSMDETVEYLAFPVTPNIQKVNQNIVNVKKTAFGVTTLSSRDFNPNDIVLTGSFGRSLKVLLGSTQISFSALQYSTAGGIYRIDNGIKTPVLSSIIKSGFGAMKVLQAIHDKSNQLDQQGQPFRLYFYNPTLGESYIVKSMALNQVQSLANNMMWNYTLSLKILGHLDTINKKKVARNSLLKLMLINEAQKKATSVLNNVVLKDRT